MQEVYENDPTFQEMGNDILEKIMTALGQVMAGLKFGAIGGTIPLFTSDFTIASIRGAWVERELLPKTGAICGKVFTFKKFEFQETQYVMCIFVK